jgi:hypothetical protein
VTWGSEEEKGMTAGRSQGWVRGGPSTQGSSGGQDRALDWNPLGVLKGKRHSRVERNVQILEKEAEDSRK